MEDPKVTAAKTAALAVSARFIERATRSIPPATPPVELDFAPIPAEWLREAPPPVLHHVRPLIVERTVSLLVAEGGVGKTTFGLHMGMAVATGVSFFGMETRPSKVVYIALEDRKESMRRRIFFLVRSQVERMRRTGSSPGELDALENALMENFVVVSAAGKQLHFTTLIMGAVVQAPQLAGLIEKLKPLKCGLLMLDPMARLSGVDENSNAAGTAMINGTEKIVEELGCSIVLPHHTGKASAREGDVSQYSARGASALVDAARSVIRMRVCGAEDVREFANCPPEMIAAGDLVQVSHPKCNEGRRADPFYLRRQELGFEVFVPERDTQSMGAARLVGLLWRWVGERGGGPFSPREIESRDALQAIFDPLRPSRHQLREAVNGWLRDGTLVSVGGPEAPGREGRRVQFRVGYSPPEEEL